MYIPQIDNLEIKEITEKVLLIHQVKTPFHFSCCDGLLVLPKEGRNEKTIALDLNIEPEYVYVLNELYGPVSNYICTHGHMDHIAHVYIWEDIGAKIHAPEPESNNLLDLKNFYYSFGFDQGIVGVDFSDIKKFGGINGYFNCKEVNSFKPGYKFNFDNFDVETLLFKGHSKSHIGFYLPSERILHISCMGFDQPRPDADGFRPWYGFNECDIGQYLADIQSAESLYANHSKFLTSSHSYVATIPDKKPFDYMRNKIKQNQKKVDYALAKLKPTPNIEDKLKRLLKQDLFFPKRKMKGFLKKIYTHWEYWIILKHIQRSKILKY